MWMPLVDVPAEIGSMRFATGSHEMGHLDLGIADASEARAQELIEARGLDVTSYGAMKAGDATFHAGWTLHAASSNPTPQMRAVMTVIWFADGMEVAEPQNRFQQNDLDTWLPGAQVGQPAATPLNPLLP
jgi:ectoine hydroxylase-related dioxygenase (phytanoyl-CoA dioxygenase family)